MKAKKYQGACGMCAKPIYWVDSKPYDRHTKDNDDFILSSHLLSCPWVSERRKRAEKEWAWKIKGI